VAAKKPEGTPCVADQFERTHDKLLAQRTKLRAEIARSGERQTRLLRMLSQVPEVADALRSNRRPDNIDAETWLDLVAFAAKGG
jgi:hypothetical protein